MYIIAVGFITAIISHFYKPAGIVLAAIGIVPLAYAFISGPIRVLIDPSSVQQVTDMMIIAFSNWLTDYLMNYPGALLFGALIGIFT